MKKFFTILITIVMITGAATAIQPEKAAQNNPNFQMGELEKTSNGLFDFFLSLTTSEDTVAPGDTLTFSAEVTTTEKIEDTTDIVKIVEVYRCDDSGCDDPNPFVEAARQYTTFTTTLEDGTTWSWKVDYSVPQEESRYEAVAYLWDKNQGKLVSTTSTTQFTVQSGSTASSDVRLTQTPSFTVDQGRDIVTGTLEIKNFGGANMPDADIVEMQVRPAGEGPLSFVSSQKVCDTSYPDNVHKEYRLDSGDSRFVTLNAGTNLEEGNSYTVYFLTREACYPDNEKTEPIYNSYNAGTFTLESSSTDTGSDSGQKVVQVSAPKLSYNSETGKISTEVSFKNEGSDMPDKDIVEMQVRPAGENPLSFSSTTQVCDPAHPENVHKKYQLGSSETASTTLSTSAVKEPGKYTVYLLTREGCAPDNEKVEPYYNSVQAGTVTIQGNTGWVSIVENNKLPVGAAVIGLILLMIGVVIRRG